MGDTLDKNIPLETERKFLIRYPDTAILSAQVGCRVLKIVQTYLLCDTGSLRVRKTVENGKTEYRLNEKRRVSELTHEEYEKVISEEAYTELLRCADSSRKPVSKTRYAFPFGTHIIELDVYPFWKDRAILEIELKCENEEYEIPDFITVIKEVSGDKRYSNKALAKELIMEKL